MSEPQSKICAAVNNKEFSLLHANEKKLALNVIQAACIQAGLNR